MTDFTNNSEDMSKKLSRRNLLRNAALAVTSSFVMLLVLTGCTKEHLDLVKGQLPGGGVGSAPTTSYVLKVTYKDERGATNIGYLSGISRDPIFSFHDYMQISAGGWKFKRFPGENGFEYWQVEDGNWFSLRYNGWAYRSSEGNRVGWKIINGKLYTDYSRWKDYAVGCQFRKDLDVIPAAYYVGVDLSNDNEFTCELVPAP